jgi:hypothetical protein
VFIWCRKIYKVKDIVERDAYCKVRDIARVVGISLCKEYLELQQDVCRAMRNLLKNDQKKQRVR